MKKKICSLCGEKNVIHEARPFEYKYKGTKFSIMQPADYCDSCGDGVINPEDRKAVQLELQENKAKIDGLLTPSEIKAIRKNTLKLTQKKASELFGGGINAFSKYERGEVGSSKLLSLTLRYLRKHPNSIKEFAGDK